MLALASIKNSFVTWLSLVMSSYWIAMRNAFIKWARAPLAAALPFVKVFDAVCINTEIFIAKGRHTNMMLQTALDAAPQMVVFVFFNPLTVPTSSSSTEANGRPTSLPASLHHCSDELLPHGRQRLASSPTDAASSATASSEPVE